MSTPEKEHIPEWFEKKLLDQADASYSNESYKEDFIAGATWGYQEASSQPSPGLRWNKIMDGQGPEEYIKVLLYWDGLQETDTGYLINNSWVNSSKEPHWALPSHWMPMPPKPGITSVQPANCYPEGGGEGEEKAQEEDIWVCPKCGYGINYHESGEGCPPYPAPQAQPVSDGKEVPEEIAQWIKAESAAFTDSDRPSIQAGMELMYHKMQEEIVERKELFEKLRNMYNRSQDEIHAARNKNNDDGMEIARLLAEKKEYAVNEQKIGRNLLDAYRVISGLLPANSQWQEKYIHKCNDLTAMIDEALQKSKRLVEVEKEMAVYKKGLQEIIKTHGHYTPEPLGNHLYNIATEYLAKYPSPTATNNLLANCDKDIKRQTIDRLYNEILAAGVEFPPAAREVFHRAMNELTASPTQNPDK